MASSARSLPWYQATASGLVKSTSAMPACHLSHCQTDPSARVTRYPCARPSSNRCERWAMYGLIQTHTCRSRSCSRVSSPSGSGNVPGSHTKSDQWNRRIQKQSKWNTDSGSPRSAIPSMNDMTVDSSYSVVNEVDSHSPYDQSGTRAGRPVSAVYRRSTSFGSGPPAMT